ncbi:MAG: sulfite exporter TauE/SafE family protein [Planctomycetia bacterium]|nr:sulfite exporter TauE/SafE family protein [Planctomycetia bacterium]
MTAWLLALAVAAVAALYAAVGHAGATGYIAVMTLFGIDPAFIRPTALVLNVVVATIGTVQFARAGHFDHRLFFPLAVASVPCAALGGWLALPTGVFATVLGGVLAVSALRIVAESLPKAQQSGAAARESLVSGWWTGSSPARLGMLSLVGGVIGLLSGLTGVGGGVFLTPVLLAFRAAPVKTVAAVTAAFILVNSLAGLAGGLVAGRPIPAPGLALAAAAAAGGVIGASLGAFRLPVRAIRMLMAAVLAIASAKLLF